MQEQDGNIMMGDESLRSDKAQTLGTNGKKLLFFYDGIKSQFISGNACYYLANLLSFARSLKT
jgi:hypothetical protein